ncbi:hypothetical protein B5X24_HaOG207035 [Helicoverpa armigera]|uniref:Uncharacterized protein n=1 Tax=Helicoverpa armigera TaxID=29058 RepID=A0A2W1BQB9_HELAM|nr:hypothetical protein B5X24_HaOG207035 [Helicoverpa armigera]
MVESSARFLSADLFLRKSDLLAKNQSRVTAMTRCAAGQSPLYPAPTPHFIPPKGPNKLLCTGEGSIMTFEADILRFYEVPNGYSLTLVQ